MVPLKTESRATHARHRRANDEFSWLDATLSVLVGEHLESEGHAGGRDLVGDGADTELLAQLFKLSFPLLECVGGFCCR